MDFTLKKFGELLDELKTAGYVTVMPDEINSVSEGKYMVLRHDVDRLPYNSYMTARMESGRGLKGVYYFRSVPSSFDPLIIRKIGELGHEIGYHYEDLALTNGDIDKAWLLFLKNLETLRSYFPVKHCCMHGSPLSRHDNRLIWKNYNYKDAGLKCEPYFDIDLSETLYITDTGRVWDGSKISIRDKIERPDKIDEEGKYTNWARIPIENSSMKMRINSFEFQSGFKYKNTDDIIRSILNGTFPSKVAFTIHPQRWTDSCFFWLSELCSQRVKNAIKYLIVKVNGKPIS